ncbi:2Fe-2S iron-sulfur cluster binding domain-containing protein [Acinetobacter sp. YIM 103518]|uniref:2Fe-2S iron-sulfur cluster binding domain-containing protein n=2 Tax=Acinetobacter faecalis TaxID=2665161 RepID=A0A6L6GH48_9GAMM|nr:2Fe-2S iron-sulfur cluster binding domain-containing protein [Acinetobacter faecalis]
MHKVTLNFSDSVTKEFQVQPHTSILDAALENDIPLLYQCRSGSCSSCICTLKDGQASTLNGKSSTLLSSEYNLGNRLLCVSKADADCSFDLDYSSDIGAISAQEVKAFINSIEHLGANAVRLKVELAEGYYLQFRPGQFMQITIPGVGVLRSYSPSSTNKSIPELEFLIRLIPGGQMSTYLTEHAKVDDVLTLSGPYGSFFLREEHKRAKHIFIAGGTGLAPILSIIDTLRNGNGVKPKMLLNFGCATPEALFCLDDIALRSQWLPTLEARICVDREAQEGHHAGSPVSALSEADITDPNTVAYLCGPQPMINAATTRLLELGVKPENIFAEQFVASN